MYTTNAMFLVSTDTPPNQLVGTAKQATSEIHIKIPANTYGLAFPNFVCVRFTIVPMIKSVTAPMAVLMAMPMEIDATANAKLFVAK